MVSMDGRWRSILAAAVCLHPLLTGALPTAAIAQERPSQTSPTSPQTETLPPAPVLAPAVSPSLAVVADQSAGLPEPDKAPAQRPILPPADPIAAAAYGVLETHCARCHQGGRLTRAAPAAGFGNILRLDEIARDPVLVLPGNPDGSRLYTLMLQRQMPFDVHQEQGAGAEPSADQLQAVREWIGRLPPSGPCRDRRMVTAANHRDALRTAADTAGPAASRFRFVSIAHLHNACATPEAMYGYRHAIGQLFNSLTWRATPVRPEPVDDQRTLYRIDLEQIGWVPAHWDWIVRSGPNPAGMVELPAEVHRPFATDTPVVRADWLAHLVLRAPLYYDILGLPGLASEIEKILRIDPADQQRTAVAQRQGIKPSQFAQQGRLLDRFQHASGTLWRAYDQLPREGRRDVSEMTAIEMTSQAFDAGLGMFTLPNGFPGFYAFNPKGDRLDDVPPAIAQRSIAGRLGVKVGVDCMGCHAGGPSAQSAAPTPNSDFARLMAEDHRRMTETFRKAGLDIAYTLDGVPPIQMLAQQFVRPVGAYRAAGELGVDPDALEKLANETAHPASLLARRLMLGVITREEMEAQLSLLRAGLAGKSMAPVMIKPVTMPSTAPGPQDVVLAATVRSPPIDPGPAVVLTSDKATYKIGDVLNLTARATADCHLTLISVDQRGRGTVLYPSDFEPNNLLTADQTLRLPSASAPYTLRLKERGRESIVAICNAAGTTVDGIRHDFERQRFTDLGNWPAFLNQAVITNAQARQQLARPAAAPEARGVKGRRRERERIDAPEPRPRPDQISRTAITIEVR